MVEAAPSTSLGGIAPGLWCDHEAPEFVGPREWCPRCGAILGAEGAWRLPLLLSDRAYGHAVYLDSDGDSWCSVCGAHGRAVLEPCRGPS